MTIKMPHQLFINGEFVDADGGKTYKTINPTDGMVRMERGDKRQNGHHEYWCNPSGGVLLFSPLAL